MGIKVSHLLPVHQLAQYSNSHRRLHRADAADERQSFALADMFVQILDIRLHCQPCFRILRRYAALLNVRGIDRPEAFYKCRAIPDALLPGF